jgi:aspartate racemase
VVPSERDREKINTIIFSELVKSQLKPASRRYFSRLIQKMAAQACDAVVLGCTEIPLLVAQADSSLPIFDSTRMLARTALKHAIE